MPLVIPTEGRRLIRPAIVIQKKLTGEAMRGSEIKITLKLLI